MIARQRTESFLNQAHRPAVPGGDTTMKTYSIANIPGDGVGAEIALEAV